MSELKQFGRALRKLINSPSVFNLLREGDWGAGGCWQLAAALVEFMGPPAELVALVSGGLVQHVLVKYADMYIDSDGAQTLKELEKKVANDPHYRFEVKLVKFTKKLQRETIEEGYIPCDFGIVKALRSELYKAFSVSNPAPSFTTAMKAFPSCIAGGLDSPKTVSDLVYQALHELDMFEEGQDGAISAREAALVRKFVQKFRTTEMR